MEKFGPEINGEMLVKITLQKRLPILRKQISECVERNGLDALIVVDEPLRKETLDILQSELNPRGLYLKPKLDHNPTGCYFMLTNVPTNVASDVKAIPSSVDTGRDLPPQKGRVFGTALPLLPRQTDTNSEPRSRPIVTDAQMTRRKKAFDLTGKDVMCDYGKELDDYLSPYGLYVRVDYGGLYYKLFITNDWAMGYLPSDFGDDNRELNGNNRSCNSWSLQLGEDEYKREQIHGLISKLNDRDIQYICNGTVLFAVL
jgi:hypothetical protein